MHDSNAPPPFWYYAALHACDIMNRTLGPPNASVSSHELVSGTKPKVMHILPFGCRVFSVIPDTAKSNFAEARSWRGINLGVNNSMPGGYTIWVPSRGTFHNTSELYFDESMTPWQVRKAATLSTVAPLVHPPRLPALSSRTILLLHHDANSRPDSIANQLTRLGFSTLIVDNSGRRLGHDAHLSDDSFYDSLLRRAALGEFLTIISSPTRDTWALSGARHGRTRSHPSGSASSPLYVLHRHYV
jgi:hypothetical protein